MATHDQSHLIQPYTTPTEDYDILEVALFTRKILDIATFQVWIFGVSAPVEIPNLNLTRCQKAELTLHGYMYGTFTFEVNGTEVFTFTSSKDVREDFREEAIDVLMLLYNGFNTFQANAYPHFLVGARLELWATLKLYYPKGEAPDRPTVTPPEGDEKPWWERLIDLAPWLIGAVIFLGAIQYIPKPRREE